MTEEQVVPEADEALLKRAEKARALLRRDAQLDPYLMLAAVVWPDGEDPPFEG